ncbi:prolipoprotein diacylglyceryl transferase family protein [Streptomyces bobili]|uniref:prolipoprotein diacylglyceryl transferase family protein n=1 Tax=Streptomyces bobili TaxID=67280 RepID=UPI00344A4644
MLLAFVPGPSIGEVHLGPLPLRGYSLLLILGITAAVWLGGRRWAARGGENTVVAGIALWAVPFGVVGARLCHVITSGGLYFGKGGDDGQGPFHPGRRHRYLGRRGPDGSPVGAVGAWIGSRRKGVALSVFAVAVAPGIALGQAIGRWGNWFNQELYGRATTFPWALEIDPARRPGATADLATYHLAFLYGSLWCLGVSPWSCGRIAVFRLGRGRAFALYAAVYAAGRFWIEYLRVDGAHRILGLRLNDWTALLVFAVAVACLVATARRAADGRDGVDVGRLLQQVDATRGPESWPMSLTSVFGVAMSGASGTLPTCRGPIMVAGRVFVAFLLSSLVNALTAVVVHALGAPDGFSRLVPSRYVFVTALGVLGGSVGWSLVRGFSCDPERLLRRLLPSVVVLSFVPDFFLFGEGEVTGVVALLVMRVAVAAIAVPTCRGVMPLSSAR